MCNVDRIICIYKKGNTVFHLFLVCVIKFLEGCHLGDIACLDTNKLALVHTIGEYEFQRAAHIEECCVMPSICLAGFLRFYTSDDVVFSGICKSQSSVQKCRDDNFIIIVGRKSDTCSCKLGCLDQQFVRGAIPYTDGKGRHRQVYMHRCKDTHNRKVIGNIISVLVLTTDDQVLEKAVSCKSLCRSCITDFVEVIQFDPDTGKKFLCGFSGDDALVKICLIIRIHILVKTSRGNGMSAGFNLKELLYKPEGLACFIEACCSICRNTAAVL